MLGVSRNPRNSQYRENALAIVVVALPIILLITGIVLWILGSTTLVNSQMVLAGKCMVGITLGTPALGVFVFGIWALEALSSFKGKR